MKEVIKEIMLTDLLTCINDACTHVTNKRQLEQINFVLQVISMSLKLIFGLCVPIKRTDCENRIVSLCCRDNYEAGGGRIVEPQKTKPHRKCPTVLDKLITRPCVKRHC